MTPQTAEPSLFDAIADLLPSAQREQFYRRMAHLRQLSPNDEMLQIAEAMGFLALVTRETPSAIAGERQKLEAVLLKMMETLQSAHREAVAYQQQLEARLAKLPQEIAQGISPEAIAAKITEGIRQRWTETGLPVTAQAIGTYSAALQVASRELAVALRLFADPQTGAVPRVNETISWMKADLSNATDHVRSMMSSLGKELWRSIAVLCAGAIGIGVVLGILFERWMAGS
jgi:hypothetical protein